MAEQEHTECYSWFSFNGQNVISRAVGIAKGQREFRGLLWRRGNCCSTNNHELC